jgi:opacity protein-like surface antigen
MKKMLVSLAAVAALSSAVFADVNNQTGCGLGAIIIKDDSSALMLALQATTNGTSANQTFGITSGTSGCKKVKLVMNERAAEFVAANMDQLAKEAAMGQGESVDTLAELLNVQDKIAFAASLQKNYNSIYTSENVKMADVLDNISTVEG